MIPGGIANDPANPPNTVNWEEFCGGKLDTTRTFKATIYKILTILMNTKLIQYVRGKKVKRQNRALHKIVKD